MRDTHHLRDTHHRGRDTHRAVCVAIVGQTSELFADNPTFPVVGHVHEISGWRENEKLKCPSKPKKMKDESSPQTLPSFCINRTTVLIAGLARGRDRMKSSIAFMLLWNEYLFHCLDDSLLFLFEPVFIFICIWTFVTFICNWTCILPSIGEKKRRQGQWMR